MVSRRLAALLAGLALTGVTPGQATAQQPSQGWPSWMVRWSPLRAAAEPADRPVPGHDASPLEPQAPRVGLLWTAANPATLVADLDSAAGWIEFGAAGLGGTFRRPLDPTSAMLGRFHALGWRRFGPRSGAIGRVSFVNQSVTPGPFADVRLPYAMDPFVLADTSQPDRSRVEAELEGGIGWTWGAWGGGLLAGLVTDRTRTTLAAAPRVTRGTVPTLTLGLSRALPVLHARLAVHGRWIGGSETTLLLARTGGTTAFQLGGYYEPDSIVLSPPSGYAYRRAERDGVAGGLGLTAQTGPIRWVAFGEGSSHRAGHRSVTGIVDPPSDRWKETATVVGLYGQTSLGSNWIFTGGAQYVTEAGDATRADLPGVTHRTRRAAVALVGDARLRAGAWTTGAWVDLSRVHAVRRDFVAGAASDAVDWRTGAGVVLVRDVGALSLGLAASARTSTPVASIPDPATYGPVYQSFMGPALSFDVTPSIELGTVIATRLWLTHSTSLFLRATASRRSARGSPPPIPAVPMGARTGWDVAAGLALVPRS